MSILLVTSHSSRTGEVASPRSDGDSSLRVDQVLALLDRKVVRRSRRLADGDSDAAEDLAQVGRLRIVRAVNAYDTNAGVPLVPYCLKSAYQAMQTERRSQRRASKRVVAISELAPLLDGNECADDLDEVARPSRTTQAPSIPHVDHVEDEERRTNVNAFMSTLSPAVRQTAHKVFWEGLSQAEVARELGVSRAAITKHMKMLVGRGRLSRHLAPYDLAA